MKKRLVLGDITAIAADALIYSTNVRLTLTGGVGAALLARYGIKTQIDLQSSATGTGRHMAEVGDVLSTTIPGAPWKVVFHTIATNEVYRTEEGTVESILKTCLRRCASRGDIKEVTCSTLGSGYGDLEPERFLNIANQVLGDIESTSIQCFSVIEFDEKQYVSLHDAAEKMNGWAVS